MAVTHALITQGSLDPASAQTTFTTASIAPVANRLYLLVVANGQIPASTVPTASGGGLTWTLVDSNQQGTGNQRITILRALSATPGSAAAVTISFGTAADNCAWKIVEFDGVDPGGTNGANAVAEFVQGDDSGATNQVALTGVTAGNATFGCLVANASTTFTADTGFVLVGDTPSMTGPSVQLAVVFSSGGTNPISINSGGTPTTALIGVELAAFSITVKAGADTPATTVTETSTVTAGQARTDEAVLALDPFGSFENGFATGEVATVTVAHERPETLALTVSEVATVTVILSRPDTLALAITDTSANISALARSETLAVGITDASAVTSVHARSDTMAAAITDASTNLSALSRPDTLAVAITEATARTAGIATADTLALALTELSATLVALGRPDTLALTVTDVSSVEDMVVIKTVSDTLAFVLGDVSAVTAGMARGDTLATTVAEVMATMAGHAAADTLAVSISEASTNFSALARTDTLAVVVADALAAVVGQSRADTLIVIVAEGSTNLIALSRADTPALVVVEASTKSKERIHFLEPSPYQVEVALSEMEVLIPDSTSEVVTLPSKTNAVVNDSRLDVTISPSTPYDVAIADSTRKIGASRPVLRQLFGASSWQQPKFLIIEAGNDGVYVMHTRLAALGYTNVTVNLNATVLADLAGYDVIISDKTAWGSSKVALLTSAYQAGYGIITSGNDNNALPQMSSLVPSPGKSSSNPPFRLEPTGTHPVRTGVTTNEDRETDTGQLAATLRATATAVATMPWGAANLLTLNQASLDTDTTGWGPRTQCTISRVTTPVAYGSGALAITRVAGTQVYSSAAITAATVPAVSPSTQYTAQAEFRAASVVRSAYVQIDWLDSTKTLISSSLGASASMTTTGWTQRTITATSPANAAYAQIVLVPTGFPVDGGGGEIIYVDKIGLNQGALAGWVPPGANPTTWTGITSFVEEDPAGSHGRWFHLHPYSSSGTFTTGTTWMQLLKRGAGWIKPTIVQETLSIDKVDAVGGSHISWTQNTPGDSLAEVHTSLNGSTWTPAVNGGAIAGLTEEMEAEGVVVHIRQRLTTYDPAVVPSISNLVATVFSDVDLEAVGSLNGLNVTDVGKRLVEVN